MGELTTIAGQGLVKPVVKWIAGCGTKRGGGQCSGTPSNQGGGQQRNTIIKQVTKDGCFPTQTQPGENYFINETYFNQLKSRSSW